MKILLLADPGSIHVVKWANSLSEKGFDITIFGLSRYNGNQYDKRITIETIDYFKFIRKTHDGNIIKSLYLLSVPKIRSIIKEFKPDILHAHSSSSYGLLGALSGFHPFFVSVWGSDVYLFPQKSGIHKKTLKFVLKQADEIFATSNNLKDVASNFVNKKINVIAFGVNTEVFKPQQTKSLFDKENIIIGSIKALDYNYGIDYLITAFSQIVGQFPNLPLKLLLVGDGSLTSKLKDLVMNLGISERTIFTGRIPSSEIVKYHNMLDISVIPSVSEGFGVSVLESSACEKPVIASNIGGLSEVVDNEVTGFLFPAKDTDSLRFYLEKLIFNPELRIKMGKAGRDKVINQFEWKNCVELMTQFYEQVHSA